jgi:phospholipid transport system transporter-binding protein
MHGDLDVQSVTAVWDTILQLPTEPSQLHIDLASIQRSDSSGVALLVEWLRLARRHGQEIRFINAPEQMQAIIRVAELDRLLPLTSRDDSNGN